MARFWEFAHLTDNLRGMSHFDKVPGTEKLYIGGLSAFYQEPDPLFEAGITHVLSVLDFDVQDARQLQRLEHLHIRAEDRADENLLKHFDQTNKFIDEALSQNGAVFVHCAMGVSRSATLMTAYLMYKHRLSAGDALFHLRKGRSRCRPNEGFVRQLEIFDKMIKAEDQTKANEIYEKWLKTRSSAEHTGSKL